MKDCPRCGSTLSHYALAEGEAYGCDACGWVGVDVEHRSEPAKLESWHDAITRFEAKFADDGAEDAVRNLERVRDQIAVPADGSDAEPEPTVDRVPDDDPTVPTADDADADGSGDEPAAADDPDAEALDDAAADEGVEADVEKAEGGLGAGETAEPDVEEPDEPDEPDVEEPEVPDEAEVDEAELDETTDTAVDQEVTDEGAEPEESDDAGVEESDDVGVEASPKDESAVESDDGESPTEATPDTVDDDDQDTDGVDDDATAEAA